MKAIFFACSESSALDAQTNRVSLFHVTDVINVVSVPYFINSIAAVAIMEKDGGDEESIQCNLKVSVGGNSLTMLPISVDFQGQKHCRTLGLFQGIMIPIAGDINFEMVRGGDSVCNWNIRVNIVNIATSEVSSQEQGEPRVRERRSNRKRSSRQGE